MFNKYKSSYIIYVLNRNNKKIYKFKREFCYGLYRCKFTKNVKKYLVD